MMDDLLQEMINPAPAPHDAPRRRRLWTTVIIVGLAAVGVTSLTTSALFTDNDSASADIRTGSVNLELGTTPAFAFTPQNLAPGSPTLAEVTVNNIGSLGLRYSVSYSATDLTGAGTGDLRDVLQLRLYKLPAAGCTEAATDAATTINNGGTTAVNWPGTPTPLVGDPTVGGQGGDRTLAATASETLCARVDFPLSAGNEYQDTGVTLELAFDAEQTLNN